MPFGGSRLVQILLPGGDELITASIPVTFATTLDVIQATLKDPANAAALRQTFASYYERLQGGQSLQRPTYDLNWATHPVNGHKWALQTIVAAQANRIWQKSQLDALGSGLVPLDANISPYLAAPLEGSHSPRLRLVCGASDLVLRLEFSHVPAMPDGWSDRLWFLPSESHEEASTTTSNSVQSLVTAVVQELGLAKISVQGRSDVKIDYALALPPKIARVSELPTPPASLPQSTSLANLLETIQEGGEVPLLVFTISLACFEKLHSQPSSPPSSSDHPIGQDGLDTRPHSLEPQVDLVDNSAEGPEMLEVSHARSGTDSTERGGTLKQLQPSDAVEDQMSIAEAAAANEQSEEVPVAAAAAAVAPMPRRPAKPAPTAVSRLSRMFEGWGGWLDESAEPATPLKREVSGPVSPSASMSQSRPSSMLEVAADDEQATDLDARFLALMDDLGIKEGNRVGMLALPDDRKLFLITQNEASKAPSASPKNSKTSEVGSESVESGLINSLSRASAVITDGWSNSFSLNRVASWTRSNDAPPSPVRRKPEQLAVDQAALSPMGTGTSVSSAFTPLWPAWWDSNTGALPSPTTMTSSASQSLRSVSSPSSVDELAQHFIRSLKSTSSSRKSLVKTLISLRVTLSSAKLSWIATFVQEAKGMEVLEQVLLAETTNLLRSKGRALAGGSVKQVDRNDLSDAIIAECVKCLRALMNTDVGFDCVLSQPSLVIQLAYALPTPSHKVRSLVVDVLAALCVLSFPQGHTQVLAALAELKVALGDRYRFDFLVNSLRVEEEAADGETAASADLEGIEDGSDEAALWEYRASAMVFINAIVNSPEETEDRVALREEFSRRGLNEFMVILGYCEPPELLLNQLHIYSEEAQDDVNELRQRRGQAGADDALSRLGDTGRALLDALDTHPDLYPGIGMMVADCSHLLSRDIDHQFKSDVLYLLSRYISHMVDLEDFGNSYQDSMKAFLAATQHLVGKQTLIRAQTSSEMSDVPSSFFDELSEARSRVEELSQANSGLQIQLNEAIATVNVKQSLSGAAAANGDQSLATQDSFSGVIQRLVQKEKQVQDLQSELTKLSKHGGRESIDSSSSQASKRSEDERGRAERQERNRQWSNLMDEIARHKGEIVSYQGQLEDKGREVKYLKRTLEAVYGRLEGQSAHPQDDDRLANPRPTLDEAGSASKAATMHSSATEVEHSGRAELQVLKLELSAAQEQLATRLASEEEATSRHKATIELLDKRQSELIKLNAEMAKLQAVLLQLQTAVRADDSVAAVHRSAPCPPPSSNEQIQAEALLPDQPSSSEPPSVPAAPPPPPPPPPPMKSNQPTRSTVDVAAALKNAISSPEDTKPSAAPTSPRPSMIAPILSLPAPLPPPAPPIPSGMASPPPPPPPGPLGSMGAPPAPPPPPPSFGQAMVRAKMMQAPPLPPDLPNKKRRALFWNKVSPHSLQQVKNVWADLLPTKPVVDLQVEELDRLFVVDPPQAKSPGNAAGTGGLQKNGADNKKAKLATLLDFTRAQNISIILSRVRTPFVQIRSAIVELDEKKLSLDNLKAIRKCLPTDDELDIIKASTADFSTLAKADQFAKEMVGIPRLQERLLHWTYMRNFELELEELKPDLKTCKDAAKEVKYCEKFKRVLQTVLLIGNVLNSSTFRGSAVGFQLNDLLKLRDTRPTVATPETPTLLHYLVRVLNNSDKSLVGFLDDCPHVEAAARLSTQNLSTNVQQLVSGFQGLSAEVELLNRSQGLKTLPNDAFLREATSFLAAAAVQIKALEKASSSISTSLTSLLSYYGEDPSTSSLKPEDFFSILSTFGQSLMTAEVEVIKGEQRKAAEDKKKEQMEAQRVAARGRGGWKMLESEANQVEEPKRVDNGTTDALQAAVDKETLAAGLAVLHERNESSTTTPTQSRIAGVKENGMSAAAAPLQRRKTRRGRGQLDEALKELRAGRTSDVTALPGSSAAEATEQAFGSSGLIPPQTASRIGGGSTIRRRAGVAGEDFGSISGRKSLKVGKASHQEYRSLSRIFLTGD